MDYDLINEQGTTVHVPVLIIGGGISGLTLSLFLLKQGITSFLVERHKTTSIHPRARGFDIRTMELYRELQISDQIREAGKALSPGWGIHTSRTLAEALKKIRPRKEDRSPAAFKGLKDLFLHSPETGSRCTQDLSEPVLLETARRRGGRLYFYTELVSFKQNPGCILAVIRDRETGREQLIHADYMVAADGAGSMVRKTLNADTVGKGALGNLLNIYFEADLKNYVKGKEFSLLRIDEPEIKGLLTSINNSDRWVFHLHYDVSRGELADDYTEKKVIPILEKVLGLPGVKIKIISILPWQPTSKVVTQMQHGRVFLAGDAAHVMTPYGGKGANSGVQDVHNLAWKLAAVINGKASPTLLKTYSIERQPIGQYYSEQSAEMANEQGLLKKTIWRFYGAFIITMLVTFFRLGKLFSHTAIRRLGGLFGLPEYKYSSPAIIDGAVQTKQYIKSGLLNGKPGTRFPHLWINHHGRQLSTLDLFGNELILITGAKNKEWRIASDALNASMQIELPVYSIGEKADLVYKEKNIRKVLGIKDTGAILVRPDGFIAWRCEEQEGDSSDGLEHVMRAILEN